MRTVFHGVETPCFDPLSLQDNLKKTTGRSRQFNASDSFSIGKDP
jgi:hypothetical protein